MSDGEWEALRPEQAGELLHGLDAPWWIAGGWALDLFLGVETEHRDLDVAVLRRDEVALREALAGWELRATPSGTSFCARPAGAGPWRMEVVLDDADGDEWRYRRDPRVRRPLGDVGWLAGTLPVARPELVLLFKATEPARSRFDRVAPRLDTDARAWLRGALDLAHPGHPWLAELA